MLLSCMQQVLLCIQVYPMDSSQPASFECVEAETDTFIHEVKSRVRDHALCYVLCDLQEPVHRMMQCCLRDCLSLTCMFRQYCPYGPLFRSLCDAPFGIRTLQLILYPCIDDLLLKVRRTWRFWRPIDLCGPAVDWVRYIPGNGRHSMLFIMHFDDCRRVGGLKVSVFPLLSIYNTFHCIQTGSLEIR